MVAAIGLWAGIVVCFAVERINLWGRMSIEQFAIDFRRSVHRVDPLQPILGIVGTLAAAAFALSVSGVASLLAWVSVARVVLVIAFSIALPERINSQFRRRNEGDAPPDAEALRARWRAYHLIRTVPSVAAFLSLTLAVTLA